MADTGPMADELLHESPFCTLSETTLSKIGRKSTDTTRLLILFHSAASTPVLKSLKKKLLKQKASGTETHIVLSISPTDSSNDIGKHVPERLPLSDIVKMVRDIYPGTHVIYTDKKKDRGFSVTTFGGKSYLVPKEVGRMTDPSSELLPDLKYRMGADTSLDDYELPFEFPSHVKQSYFADVRSFIAAMCFHEYAPGSILNGLVDEATEHVLRTGKLSDGCKVRTDVDTIIAANDLFFNDCDDWMELMLIAQYVSCDALLEHIKKRVDEKYYAHRCDMK